MFIKPFQKYNRTTKQRYTTYRLCESYRFENHVRHRTIIGFGKLDELETVEEKKLLAKRIEEMLKNGKSKLPINIIDEKVEKLALHFYNEILKKKSYDVNADWETVDMSSIKNSDAREIGAEWMCKQAFDQLGIGEFLYNEKWTESQISLAATHIISRAVFPASELKTVSFIKDNSAVCELTYAEKQKITKDQLYGISHKLFSVKDKLEQYLSQRTNELFDLEDKIILYDLTNTYFEGQSKANSFAANGHSKEKRSDCPLVTLGLVLDASGFPRRSQVYKGNVSEPTTLAEMLQDLEGGRVLTGVKPTVVMDAGIAIEENIAWLREHQYPYLVVSRKRHREFDEESSVVVKMDAECTVKAQKVFDEETQETLLYCHSSQREKKDQAIGDRITSRLEEALQKLADGLQKKRFLKKYDKVMVKIGSLRQKYSRASKQYTISVEKDDISGNATKITWQQEAVENTTDSYPGVYCLRTSHAEWDESLLWNTYTMLTDLEAVFRSLKSELGLRPIHHQITDRVAGHLFITVLAYHLVHTIRFRLKREKIHSSWSSIRKLLSSQSRVTVSMQCKSGNTVHVRKSTRPELKQQEIYSALGIKSHPGKTIKTTI